MIRYALACEAGHEFEGWFSASADFDDQAARGLLTCPVCETREVRKQIMAPALMGTGKRDAVDQPAAMRQIMREAMNQVRAHVENHFDYVGPRFAAEARAIHTGQSEERGIYGEASPSEVKALVDEGVRIAPLPPPEPKKTELN